MKSSIEKINTKELLEIKKYKKTFVFFYATWCGQSKMSFFFIEKVKKNFPEIEFYCIDVDEQKLWITFNKTFKIEKVPTFIIFENDKELKRGINFKNENQLIDFISNL